MPIDVTADLLETFAIQLADAAMHLDGEPTIQWLHQEIDRQSYATALNSDEKEKLIHLIRTKHLVLETEIYSVVSTKIKYQPILKERLDIFSDKNAENTYFWSRYKKTKASKPVLLHNTDRDTNRILAHMPDPKSQEKFCSLGMVIGDVQAGKTGNYSALINKAADLGYKLIIVLTGVTEVLRSQTQQRLDEDFIGVASVAGQNIRQYRKYVGVGLKLPREKTLQPFPITDRDQDLKNTSTATHIQIQASNSPVIIVTKKNITLLRHLLDWMVRQEDEAGEGVDSPVLIIDDESDNASVNTGKEDEEPKAVNLGIRKIMSRCNKVAYVAYTATPFANIFIDPDSESDTSGLIDLYPKDFIVALQAPPNYCGGRFFYNDDEDMPETSNVKKYISDAESNFPIGHKSTDQPSGLPVSLKTALRQFFICCAIKDIRRTTKIIDSRDKHDSCLINVSRFKGYQNTLRSLVEIYVESIVTGLQTPGELKGSMLGDIKNDFESYYVEKRAVAEGWSQVKAELLRIGSEKIIQPTVVSINSESIDVLDYPKEEPRRYIAIGGFKLARGLTLEGLTVSYFYRRSKMYDTLMQMARWFGYRDGYKDLVTLWTTKAAAGWYQWISQATEELKVDLVEMEKLKREPSEFGMRVKSHEASLIITAQNKMRSGTEIKGKTRYDDTLKETFYVDVRPEKQLQNIELAKRFVDLLGKNKQFEYVTGDLGYFKDVAASEVLRFMRAFDVFPGNNVFMEGLYLPFIERRMETEYRKWDVAFYLPKNKNGAALCHGEQFEHGARDRNIRRLAAQSGLAEHGSLSHLADYELPLGDNRLIRTGALEAIGVPNMTYEAAAKKTPKECRALKMHGEGNPLLAVQLINIGFIYDDSKSPEDASTIASMRRLDGISKTAKYPALSISLPKSEEDHESDNYVITKNEAKNIFGMSETDYD